MYLKNITLILPIILCAAQVALTEETGNLVCPTLTVSKMKIYNPSGFECTYTANGRAVTSGEVVVPGVWTGLIEYKCGPCTGTLISIKSCAECGLFCMENEFVADCQQVLVPGILGAFIGLIVGVVIAVLVYHLLLWMCPRFVVRPYMEHRLRRGMQKDEKFKARWERVNRSEQNASAPVYNSPDVDQMIALERKLMDNRYLDLAIEQPKPEPSPPAVPERPVTVTRRHSGTGLPPMVFILAVCLTLLVPAQGDDRVMYITGENKVCDPTGHCQQLNTYAFTMSVRQTINFVLVDGRSMLVTVKETGHANTYYPVYYATDYELRTRSYAECQSRGGSCWLGGNCKPSSVLPALSFTNATVSGGGCNTDAATCMDNCYRDNSCIWYTWGVYPRGEKATVYRMSHRVWYADVTVTLSNATKEYTLTADRPFSTIDMSQLYAQGELPMSASAFSSTELVVDEYLVSTDGHFYAVEAAARNMPRYGQVGDYQVALLGHTSVMDQDSVVCKTSVCTLECKTPMPGLRRLRSLPTSILDTMERKGIVTYNDVRAVWRESVDGHLDLMMGNINVDHMHVQAAHCQINIPTTWGCSGCTQKPYAVITTHDIQTYGTLVFTSNCSFSTNTLSCSTEPYRLLLEARYECCQLHIKVTNQTLNFCIDYYFIGDMTDNSPVWVTAKSTMTDTLSAVLRTPAFFNYTLYALVGTTLLSTAGAVASRVLSYIIIARSGKSPDV